MKIQPKAAVGPRLYPNGRGAVPSVTEVLRVVEKPYFERWRHRVGRLEADKTMNAAQTFGTKLHAAAVLVAKNQMPAVEVEMKPYATAVCDFLNMHVLEVLHTEKELVSAKHEFGGTLDLYCQLWDGSYAVVDYKTTSSLTREHGLQVAAYAILCKEHGMTVNRRIVVRIKKEAPGKFYARAYAEHAEDVEAFLALKTYWHWANRRKIERAA